MIASESDPAVVGVPEIVPVDGSSANPAGSEPAGTDQVYAPTPPLALSVALYGTPTVAAGRTFAFSTTAGAEYVKAAPPVIPSGVYMPENSRRPRPTHANPRMIDCVRGKIDHTVEAAPRAA